MWSNAIVNVTRLKCILIVLGIVLPPGLCQNAEPRQSEDWKTITKTTPQHRYDRPELSTNPSTESPDTVQELALNWPGFSAGEEASDDEREEVTLQAKSNKEDGVLSPEEPALDPGSPSGRTNSSRPVKFANYLASHHSRCKVIGSSKRRRLSRRFRSEISAGDESNSTSSPFIGSSVHSEMRDGSNVELNNVEGSRKERERDERAKMMWSQKRSKSGTSRDRTPKEAKDRRKKIRSDRRRRRNRERKRKGRTQEGQRRKTRKGKKPKLSQHESASSAFSLRSNSTTRIVTDTDSRSTNTGESPNVGPRNETGVKKIEKFNSNGDDRPASASGYNFTTNTMNVGDENRWGNFPSDRNGDRQENVEREFAKQFERELSKSRPEEGESTEARNFHGDGRAENEKKALGYSMSENELPSDETNTKVFAKMTKSYNDYIASTFRRAKLPDYQLQTARHLDDGIRRTNFADNSNASGLGSNTPTFSDQGRPLENLLKKALGLTGSGDTLTKKTQTGTELEKPEETDATTDDNNSKGDLSCINGTFLPAPLVRHALIKYVKSSIPGHGYLEADYECTPGYSLVTPRQRLLCHNRRWLGPMPKCKLVQNSNDVCADSACKQVCTEVNGAPYCSCYKGFRREGNKCIDINECQIENGGCEFICFNTPGSYRCECPKGMRPSRMNQSTCTDINECLLNNGHGPCQDTCQNLNPGYKCSCDGLPGTSLAPNNHTCQDAGPCGLNNAGCSHTCLSTMGRIFCLCPDGFMLEDDWKTCQDVDECAVPDLQTVVCQHGCINTPGSYRCADPPEMKDQPRSDLVSTPCKPGFQLSADSACVDINECAVSNGGCHEVCENTDGSFFCACNGDERLLAADGKTCVGITDVACPALNPSGRGYVMCSRLTTPKPWRGRKRVINRPGTKCFLRCPDGYQLRGEYELSCSSNGSWVGSKHGECVRYSKPRLGCPEDVVAEVPPGQSEAFVRYAQPSTDLDWFRYVRSEPSWGTRLEANLIPGQYKVTFVAKHPVSKKQASCTLRITVKRGEAPRIKNCPENIVASGPNGTVVNWTTPIFTDNIKVIHVTSNESPGHSFPVGVHKVQYEASDEAGWTATCDFLVTVRGE